MAILDAIAGGGSIDDEDELIDAPSGTRTAIQSAPSPVDTADGAPMGSFLAIQRAPMFFGGGDETEQVSAANNPSINASDGRNRAERSPSINTGGGTPVEIDRSDDGGWLAPITSQFDEEAGGGFGDWAIGGVQKESGLREWQQSETYRELSQQVAEGGILARIDAGARGGIDFLLDNPRLSVQEGVQGAMLEAFQIGAGDQSLTDEDLGQAWQGAYEGTSEAIDETVQGSPFDNPVTHGLSWLGQAAVADPAKGVFGGVTGVDVETGSTEATVGAADLFDVGVGVTTFGAGTALARGAGEGGTLLSRLVGGADEAAAGADEAAAVADDTPALPAPDEAVGASDEAVGASVRSAEESGTSGFRAAISGSDEGASAAEDVATAGAAGAAAGTIPRFLDDIATTLDEGIGQPARSVLGFTDEGASAADDAATSAAQASDESGGLFSRVFGGSDEAAAGADETASAADDAASGADEVAGATDEQVAAAVEDVPTGAADETSAFRRAVFGTTTTGRVARGAGALLAGGAIGSAVLDAPDQIETRDGSVMTAAKNYEPTNRFPNGGRLYDVRRNGTSRGYWLLVGINGRNLIVLDESGDTRRAQISADQFRSMVQGGNQ